MVHLQEHHSPVNKAIAGGALLCVAALVFLRSGDNSSRSARPSPVEGERLQVATWNIAAINNNPFEYWITHDDAAYNEMMTSVQDFIEDPQEHDVPVSDVFGEQMFEELVSEMTALGWEGVNETAALWHSDFKNRRIVSGFMKDKSLGSKRLASMPDRTTNTVRTLNGVVYRPTVINCYQKLFSSTHITQTMADWWSQWSEFIFRTSVELHDSKNPENGSVQKPVHKLLLPIKRAKYPALTEEEERISLPLQTMCGAIFDAILVHIVTTLAKDSWQQLRSSMCTALNLKKTDHTLGVLHSTYGDSDIIFLQEVAADFIEVAKRDPFFQHYHVVAPNILGKRDQNSVMLLSNAHFQLNSVVEVSDAVNKQFEGREVPVATGDILAITVKDKKGVDYLLASFHGDTNGLATIPVVEAVHNARMQIGPNHHLIFGLDANTYEFATPGKTQDVMEFARFYGTLGLTSVWGDLPDPKNHTTYSARTFLQPQLNKAARKDELLQKGDVNPKDFILFYKEDFMPVVTKKDNTGLKKFVEGMVFPTLKFPSDHGVLSSVLEKRDGS